MCFHITTQSIDFLYLCYLEFIYFSNFFRKINNCMQFLGINTHGQNETLLDRTLYIFRQLSQFFDISSHYQPFSAFFSYYGQFGKLKKLMKYDIRENPSISGFLSCTILIASLVWPLCMKRSPIRMIEYSTGCPTNLWTILKVQGY